MLENKFISSPKPPPAKIDKEPKPSSDPTYANETQPRSPPNGWRIRTSPHIQHPNKESTQIRVDYLNTTSCYYTLDSDQWLFSLLLISWRQIISIIIIIIIFFLSISLRTKTWRKINEEATWFGRWVPTPHQNVMYTTYLLLTNQPF